MSPQLSIIIPTYKRNYSLQRLLNSLIQQQNISLEIIVVDQNEPGYFSIELMDILSKVIYIHQENPNTSLARNAGFKKSSAEYILFLDDDLTPDYYFCSKGLKVFADFPLIKCFVPLVYSDKGKESALVLGGKKRIDSYPGNNAVFSVTDEVSAAVFFERYYFKLSGGFDTYLFDFARTSEDFELFSRMRKRNMILWFVPTLEIFHDEKVEGGCELRVADYWVSRRKNIRALALYYRIHNHRPGQLSLKSFLQLIRFSFINKKAFKSGIENIIKEIRLLKSSNKASKVFFFQHTNTYFNSKVSFIDE